MSTYCIVCARIHIEPEFREYYSQNKIPIWKFFKENKLYGEKTYLDYFYEPLINTQGYSGTKEIYSEEFKQIVWSPDYWGDVNGDMFISIGFLEKISGILETHAAASSPFVSDLDIVQKSCEKFESIPA